MKFQAKNEPNEAKPKQELIMTNYSWRHQIFPMQAQISLIRSFRKSQAAIIFDRVSLQFIQSNCIFCSFASGLTDGSTPCYFDACELSAS